MIFYELLFEFFGSTYLNLSRVYPSEDWIQSQIPEIVQNGVKCLGNEMDDIDEMDIEASVQAYVNIVAGGCISLGKLQFWSIRKIIHIYLDSFYFTYSLLCDDIDA